MIEGWRVAGEHSFSDHTYLIFNLNIHIATKPAFRNHRRTNWVKYRESLEDSLSQGVPTVPSTQEELDYTVETLTRACNLSLEVACPVIQPRGKPKPAWWTPTLGDHQKASRKAFNRAKSTGEAKDWDSYKENLRIYKREIRKAQRKSWRQFCGKMEGVSETSRLRKILSKSPTTPSYLIRPDGSWTTSSMESLELLMETHFPGSSEMVGRHEVQSFTCSPVRGDLISKDRIRWAINGFKPYKSAGPDRIIPAELQNNWEIILPWLEIIFTGCLKLLYIPKRWREVSVIFIPKAGRSSHGYPKDLRPITLSSFLLKTFERLIETHIRAKVNPGNWSSSQHAYCKGRSVDTALHSLVRSIEASLNVKEYSLVAFLDIEGAFNNVRVEAIMEGLNLVEVDQSIHLLISQMLKSRIVKSELKGSTLKRRVYRGTPQGGVLSPLLWNLVINGLLLELEREGIGVVAYADDVALAVSGKHLETIKGVMQNALQIVTKWAGECGLGVNPSKTELVLFTKKYKILSGAPIILNGVPLAFTDKARFLGTILDSKLSWKPNILERVKKATTALYSCKSAIGKRWGLKPELVHWLYTAVARPILMYGVSVWWPALDKVTYVRLLERVQRTACMLLSGALRTTPTKALEVMFHLLPVDIFGKQLAAYAAARLSAVGQWKCLRIGHSKIIESLGGELGNLDYITTVLCFKKNFRTMCPSRDFWEGVSVPETEALQFYTDGSKLDGRVGAGVFCDKLNLSRSVRLPDYCSVYQAEVIAIGEALDWLRHNVVSTVDIAIYVDSQAAIKSLESVSFSSRVALDCHSSLNEMGEHFNIQIIWVPGHSDVVGNCRVDELARKGSTLHLLPERADVGKPMAALRLALKKRAESLTNERWTSSSTCGVARQVWPKLDLSRSKTLISLQRRSLRTTVGILTGHCILGEHARRLGLQFNDFCRSCGDVEEEETVAHLLCSCPALACRRNSYLGSYMIGSLSELGDSNVKDILRFVRSSKWF